MIVSSPINNRWGGAIPFIAGDPSSKKQRIEILGIILFKGVEELRELQKKNLRIRELFCCRIFNPQNESILLKNTLFEVSLRNTPLGVAIAMKKWDFVKYMVSQLSGKELDAPCSPLGSPLVTCLLTKNSHGEILEEVKATIRHLLNAGADPNLTGIHYEENEEIRKCDSSLLEAINPLSIALFRYPDDSLIELLINYGAKRTYYFNNPTKTDITRQEFNEINNKRYKEAKKNVEVYKKCKLIFLFAFSNPESIIKELPKELVFYILSFINCPNPEALLANEKARLLWREKKHPILTFLRSFFI